MCQLVNLYKQEDVTIEGELVAFANPWREGKMGPGPENFSNRKCCAKCYGAVANFHPAMGKIDICGGILDSFEPGMHINYASCIYAFADGLPKFKDLPAGFGGSDEKLEEGAEKLDEPPELPEGSCYCGAVSVKATGQPVVSAICHCVDCRKWGGGMGQLVNLYKEDDVTVEGELVAHANPWKEGKMGGEGFSNRKSCAKCFGKVSNDHAPMGKRDICGGILRSTIKPQMHINYASRLMRVCDGLPKFKDMPAAFGGSDETIPE